MILFACVCVAFWACDDEEKGISIDPSVVQAASDFTDSRDGRVYKCIQIGNQIWMAENLAYYLPNGALDGCFTWDEEAFDLEDVEIIPETWVETATNLLNDPAHDWAAEGVSTTSVQNTINRVANGQYDVEQAMSSIGMFPFNRPFYNALLPLMDGLREASVAITAQASTQEAESRNGNYSKIYGYLYTYDGAVKAVPEGWRLPTDEDWKVLEETLGIPHNEVERLNAWRGEGVGTALKEEGMTGFNARMAGGDVFDESTSTVYIRQNETAYFWSSTLIQESDSIDLAMIRSVAVYSDAVWRGTSRIYNGRRNMKYSIRCVKDAN